MKLGERLLTQPKWLILTIAFAMVFVIGWLDRSTVWELSFFMFYAVPVFIVAWTCPRGLAIGFGAFCALVSWGVNLSLAPDPKIHAWRSVEPAFGLWVRRDCGFGASVAEEIFSRSSGGAGTGAGTRARDGAGE